MLVIARHRESLARGHHAHDEPQHCGGVRSPVHEVTEEQCGAPLGRDSTDGAALLVSSNGVAECGEQGLQFAEAAVNVTDDIEGTPRLAAVAAQRRADELRRLDRLDTIEHMHRSEAFFGQPAHRPRQLLVLTSQYIAAERPVHASCVALGTDRLRHIENDRHWEDVVLARESNQRLSRGRLHIGGVDHGQQPRCQPLGDDELHQFEGVLRRALQVGIVADHAATDIARYGLERIELCCGEGGLARSTDPDQHDQRQVGNVVRRHAFSSRVNTAI